jgi:hypothetical protein
MNQISPIGIVAMFSLSILTAGASSAQNHLPQVCPDRPDPTPPETQEQGQSRENLSDRL